ncbi:hypothetical protein C8R43DRAFT_941276 [Mycena crocata]|nr:hypothetical protein C8R43DRAFT_941276 [Mycena crocata]
MPFLLSRQEILELLLLMGVDLSTQNRLTDEKLNKRLTHVLDGCQYISRVVPDPPMIPSSYQLWDLAGKLGDRVARSNVDEANPIPMHTNAFRDLRHILKDIATHPDQGYKKYAFQDPQMTSDIRLKVVEVRKFDGQTPIFTVQYQHHIRKGTLPVWADAKLPTTLKEQHLLLWLLNKNSKRLDPSYRPDGLEDKMKALFLLPVGPLTAKDRGKHNTIEGCPNGGESGPTLKKCSRCLSVSYRSRGFYLLLAPGAKPVAGTVYLP